MQGISPQKVFIVDSSSNDGTAELAKSNGYNVTVIERESFDHGGTRQMIAARLSWASILVYLTQDVVPEPNAIQELLQALGDSQIGAAFGRQLPRQGAKPIEEHSRAFNYPDKSVVRTLERRKDLGFKAIFFSNAFSAYRREALMSVGGFPQDVIVSEETIVSAKLLMAGWKTAYVAEARVRHSHDFTVKDEFTRFFDVGVLHSNEPWLLKEFGGVGGEGARYIKSELVFLWPKYAYLIPLSFVHTAAKLAGYRTGRLHRFLPRAWKIHLSQQASYWKRRA
jgi:rhamnosyltransferase